MPRVAVMRGSAVLGQHGQGKMCQGAVAPRVMVGERVGGGCPNVSRSGRPQMCHGGLTQDFTHSAPPSTPGSACPPAHPSLLHQGWWSLPLCAAVGALTRACSPLGSKEITCVKRVQGEHAQEAQVSVNSHAGSTSQQRGREDAVENVRAQFMGILGDPREII